MDSPHWNLGSPNQALITTFDGINLPNIVASISQAKTTLILQEYKRCLLLIITHISSHAICLFVILKFTNVLIVKPNSIVHFVQINCESYAQWALSIPLHEKLPEC